MIRPRNDPAPVRLAFVTARGLLRAKRSRPGTSDLAYALYIGVMLTIIVAAPVVRAAILGLAGALGGHGSLLVTDVAMALFAAVTVGFSALLVLAAAHTGPAHATLPDLDLLVAGPFTRGRVLGSSVARVCVVAAMLGAGVGALFAGAWSIKGGLAVESCLALLLLGATVGLLAAVAMLAGQISRKVRYGIAGLMASLLLLHLLAALGALPGGSIPDPWSAFALAAFMPNSGGQLLSAAAWFVIVLALTMLTPWLLGRLAQVTLRTQSLNMNAVSALALSGDLRMATELLGAPVRTGRRLQWRLPAKAGLAIAVRDFVGFVRTPARSLAAFAGVAAMGTTLGITNPQATGPLWAAVIGAMCVTFVYMAIGPWCRGLRAASQTLGGMALLPQSPVRLIARHSIVPGFLAVAVTSLVAGVVSACTAGAIGSAIVYGAVVGILAQLFRILGALKGPLPQRLLAPVPTPAGDMAGLNVLLWTLDGIVWAIIAGAVLGALASFANMAALIASVIFMVALVAWSVTRLRSTLS